MSCCITLPQRNQRQVTVMPSSERVEAPASALRAGRRLHNPNGAGAVEGVRRKRTPGVLGALAALAAAFAPPGAASAMEFRHTPGHFGRFVINASGSIGDGDAEKFREALGGAAGRKVHLSISSSGGLVREAMEIARAVKAAGIPVAVGDMCASACFFVLAASPDRTVKPNSRVGVHRAYGAAGETEGSLDTTMDLARYARSLGVPAPIVAHLVTTPGKGDAMTWLSAEELRSMNVKVAQPGAQQDQQAVAATPAAAAAPPPAPPGAMYNAGRADRLAYRRWFNGLTESGRQGAVFWMRQRNLPRPGNCLNGEDSMFALACHEAQRWWARADRMGSDPDYRRAWEGQ